MARYYGKIGYAIQEETKPGVYQPKYVERYYYGDVLRIAREWRTTENVNDDLEIQNEISIVADAYAYQHFHEIKYVEWYGAKWKVSSVTVERPRLVLSIGGVYNQ